MKTGVIGALAALGLAAIPATAMADSCPAGSNVQHTIETYTFGFFPNKLYVCPGDEVRFQNKSVYRMKVDITAIVFEWDDEENEAEYLDYNSGDMSKNDYSAWFKVGPESEAEFDPQLSDYNYGAAPYPMEIVIGLPPTSYGPGERYTDPQG